MLEEIQSIRKNKASKIITKNIRHSLKPRLEETTYKSYFKYTIPQTILKKSHTLNIGGINSIPEIVMASTIYNLFRDVMIIKLREFIFCWVFISFELKLHKPDGTEIKWKSNLGRMDMGSMKEFWLFVQTFF